VDSVEFSEWVAFWLWEAELSGAEPSEPDQDQLTSKIYAWAERHNAAWAAQEARRVQKERVKR
jgi:hypothetical protein